jgi:hypothetical protein
LTSFAEAFTPVASALSTAFGVQGLSGLMSIFLRSLYSLAAL